MNRARNISMLAYVSVMAMVVALAPLIRRARRTNLPRHAAAHRGRLRQAADGGSGAAPAHHPDDAGRAAALRHVAQAAAVGRAARAPPSPPPLPVRNGRPPAAATRRRRRPRRSPRRPASGGERVGSGHAAASRRASGSLKEAYVYVDIAKGSSARGHTLEIKQKDKQFSPQVAVVQTRDQRRRFPTWTPVFHSVFSTSGRNSFDLGSYRSGDPARSVDADHARGRGGVLQHPREDEREHPGRPGPAVHQGRRRRQLPHGERPRRVTPHRGLEPQRQARPAEGRRRRRAARQATSRSTSRARRRTRTSWDSLTALTRNEVSIAWPRATIRHDTARKTASLICAAAASRLPAGRSSRAGGRAPRQRRRAEKRATKRRACCRRSRRRSTA